MFEELTQMLEAFVKRTEQMDANSFPSAKAKFIDEYMAKIKYVDDSKLRDQYKQMLYDTIRRIRIKAQLRPEMKNIVVRDESLIIDNVKRWDSDLGVRLDGGKITAHFHD